MSQWGESTGSSFPPPVPPNPFSGNPYESVGYRPRKKRQAPLLVQIVIGGIFGIGTPLLIVAAIRSGALETPLAQRPVIEQRKPEPQKPKAVVLVSSPVKKKTAPPMTFDMKARVPEKAPEKEKPAPPPVIPQRKPREVPAPREEPKPPDIAKQIDILQNFADPKARLNAVKELRDPRLRLAFNPERMEKLLLGLSDVSPDVQLEVVELLGELQDVAALPGLVKYREREIGDKLRGQAAVSILRIAPNSNEAKQAFIPYLAGGKGGRAIIKALPAPALTIRIEACQYLSKYGASAKWSEPILLDILTVTARNLDAQGLKVFEAACDAMSRLKSHEPETIKKLEQFVAGKGFISKKEESITQAKILADSVFRIATKVSKPKEDPPKVEVVVKPVEIKISAKASSPNRVFQLSQPLGTQC